jgi:hypothetical protein
MYVCMYIYMYVCMYVRVYRKDNEDSLSCIIIFFLYSYTGHEITSTKKATITMTENTARLNHVIFSGRDNTKHNAKEPLEYIYIYICMYIYIYIHIY